PYAKRIHLKAQSGGLRQLGLLDPFRPKKVFAPRPFPSVVYLYRSYFPASYVRSALLLGVLPSFLPFNLKRKKSLYPLAMLFGFLLSPLLLVQVLRSWKESSRMLRMGNKIEWL